MIKVKINGIEFECDSAADAAELAKLMVPAPVPAPSSAPGVNYANLKPAVNWPIKDILSPNNASRQLSLETVIDSSKLPKDVSSFIYDLTAVAGRTMEGDELSNALGLKSKNGLGPRFRSVQRVLAVRNIDLEKLVRKSSASSRERQWIVASKEEIEREFSSLKKN